VLNCSKWLTGLAVASFFTVAELPGVFPQSVARAESVAAKPHRTYENHLKGRINIVYEETDDPLSAELIQGYQQYGLFDRVTKLITEKINLPRDITVVFKDCGQANAVYFSREATIVMCNELTKENYELFRQNGYGQEEALKAAIFASVFIFYHESGHMVIDQLDLPIVGKEEDAADQFAAFFLSINDTEDKSISGEIVMAAANLFDLTSTAPKERDFQDEHSLSKQRFYSLVCMLYGTNPEKYHSLAVKLDYTKSRLHRCQAEAGTITMAWQRLLEPYLKT
jgi:hypothetical protein